MNVRHATLMNVFGRPAKYAGFSIMPAHLKLEGQMFRPSYRLAQLPSDRIPPVLRIPIERGFDVAWVRARIPIVFGYAPDVSEVEKSVLYEGFLAVSENAGDAVPFECSDYYGKTSLTFSPAETDEPLKQSVADAFWGVLLADPNALADFEARTHSEGHAGYGCRDGEPYSLETEDGEAAGS